MYPAQPSLASCDSGDPRNAVANRFLSWPLGYTRSIRVATLARRHYESAQTHQHRKHNHTPRNQFFSILLQLVVADLGVLESFCLIGYVESICSTRSCHLTFANRGIPVVMSECSPSRNVKWPGYETLFVAFTSKKYAFECRSEASQFVQLLCHSSLLTLQMFIS